MRLAKPMKPPFSHWQNEASATVFMRLIAKP